MPVSTIKHRGMSLVPVVIGKKQTRMASGYDIPRSTKFMDYYYLCCGFFKVHAWGNEHPSCSEIVRPYRQHQLQLSTEAMLGFHITECHGGPQTFMDALNTCYVSVQ